MVRGIGPRALFGLAGREPRSSAMSLLTRALLLVAPRRSVRAAFTRHYRRRDWDDPESVSGRGSSLRSTEAIRRELPALCAEFQIRSVVDAGCGDFNWFRDLKLDLESYVGIEVVEDLARRNAERHGGPGRRFVSLDVIRDPLPRADLILCRDCLVHFSTADVWQALQNIARSGSTYLLTTTFTDRTQNQEIATGDWRPLNLEIAPFQLPEPLHRIDEHCPAAGGQYRDKSLALWRVADLAKALARMPHQS